MALFNRISWSAMTQHRAIPDASSQDIPCPDPNDDADMDVPDQQALMDAFIATRNMSCISL